MAGLAVVTGFVGLVGLAALASLSGAGCRKSVPEAPPPNTAALPPFDVKLEGDQVGRCLFIFADPAGGFNSTLDPKTVPPQSRRVVRVVDPARAADRQAQSVSVHVLDLDELEKRGKATATPWSREAFETAAIAQLPPGASSEWPAAGEPPVPGKGAGGAANEPVAGSEPTPDTAVVTVYGTSWCPSCRAAKAYLKERKIPFADKDIERDPAAAAELRQKAKRMGISADRVPVLDVRGSLMIGFDRARLDYLLGEAS